MDELNLALDALEDALDDKGVFETIEGERYQILRPKYLKIILSLKTRRNNDA